MKVKNVLETRKEEYDYSLEFLFGELKTASNAKRLRLYGEVHAHLQDRDELVKQLGGE